MLSERSSFIATYCCDLIFCASLAPIGRRAEDSTTAPSSGCFARGSRVIAAGDTRLADNNVEAAVVEVTAVAAADELDAAGTKSGRPANEAAGGRTPRCGTYEVKIQSCGCRVW